MAEDEEQERNQTYGAISLVFWAVFFFVWYKVYNPSYISIILIALTIVPLAYLTYLVVSYVPKNEDESRLYGLKPALQYIPVIKKPDGHVSFKMKMIWDLTVLVLYFALTNVAIFGLDQTKTLDLFSEFRAIMAGASGSLMHLGIGPIVTASIIMQLFAGAKIIKLDLTKDEDKSVYQSTQKLLVIITIFVEAVPQVYGYLTPDSRFISSLDAMSPGNGLLIARLLIVLQLFAGSYLVFLMDEVVSKWGLGSGVSLFIAAGVAEATIVGTFNWEVIKNSVIPAGALPKTIYYMTHLSTSQMANGGFEKMFLGNPNPIIGLLGTTAIFFIVAFFQSTRVELPLAHERARGARGRYPINLVYASNIPVILMSALLANIAMFALLFWSNPAFKNWPVVGHNWMLGFYKVGQTKPSGGFAWYVTTIRGVGDWLLPLVYPNIYLSYTGHTWLQVLIRVIVFVSVMIIGSVIFARFWIETTNMGAKSVAENIQRSGMQIPGFRRDPRVLEKVLQRYIPAVTDFSGAFVGALAAGADLMGTVGNTSGTGVLLAVGIMIQMYEAMGKEQMVEMHPMLRQFFGKEG